MHKVDIFIAEDDKDDYLLLKEAIEVILPKFNIDRSRNGLEFLEKLKQPIQPDLILLDLSMPKKNGLDCLVTVRQTARLKTTPVIIYSTSSFSEDIEKCYNAGCTLYMVKPTCFDDIVTQIRKVFFRLGLPKKTLLNREMFVVQKQVES